MSSAYITQELGGNISGKSFMYIRCKIGPRTMPCGTPMLTLSCEDRILLNATDCFLLDK